MEVLIIFIAIIVFVSCIGIIKKDKGYKAQVSNDDEKHLEYLSRFNVTRSREFIWNDVINHHYFWFIADNKQKKIYVTTEKTGDIFIPIDYEKIMNAKIVIDSSVHGQITRAIVGGAIAGTAGAIVGAHTAKSKVDFYKLVIEIDDIYNPTYEFVLIDEPSSTDSYRYKNASDFAENVLSVLKVIVFNNN